MAPLKSLINTTRGTQKPQLHSISTRSRTSLVTSNPHPKRKADFSPVKDNAKRSALGEITNAKKKLIVSGKQPIRKAVVKTKTLPSVKTVVKVKELENVAPQAPNINGVLTRKAIKQVAVKDQTATKPKDATKEVVTRVKTRLSNEFEKTEESLYLTALEDVNDPSSSKDKASKKDANNLSMVSQVTHELENKLNLGNHEVPEGVVDFDKENWNDVFQVSHYAMDIFNYLKSREQSYQIPDYMDRQVCLTTWMRSLLIDWMVEVQESFELNHETLYLGVKLVDLYLSRVTVGKETLQLVGAASMFVASKFDERIPPAIKDFLYICDGAYTRKELVRMEINLLKICGFNLAFPLSYRFLRRYARCAKITMPLLTLGRFILETSLMDYATVTRRDSKLASAALYLALKMKKMEPWSPTLEFYTGYKLDDFKPEIVLLNNSLHQKPKSPVMTVRNKYSHKIFFEVANTPLISNDELF